MFILHLWVLFLMELAKTVYWLCTAEGLQWLSKEFGLCSPLKEEDVNDFKAWLQETWVNLAMVDYPYEANFLQHLPPWPIKVLYIELLLTSCPL